MATTKKPATKIVTGYNQAQVLMEKSNKTLATTLTNIGSALEDLNKMQIVSSELVEQIFAKQGELDSLNETLANESRKHKAELELQFIENKRGLLDRLLNEFDLAEVSKEDLNQINAKLIQDDEKIKIEQAKAVASATAAVKAQNEIATLQLESQHKEVVAKLKADAESLQHQVKFLEQSNVDLKQMLDDERNARIKVAEASQPIMQQQPLTNVR